MKLNKQSVEYLDQTEMNYSKHIERCGRVCYQSDHLIKEGSDEKFVQRILNNGHTSVLEHYWVTIEFDRVKEDYCGTTLISNKYLRYVHDTDCTKIRYTGNLRAWLQLKYKNKNLRATLYELFPLLFDYAEGDICKSFINANGPYRPITMRIITNRAIANELVRHRVMSFSQESTRFCDYAKKDLSFIQPWGYDTMSRHEKEDINSIFSRSEANYMASKMQPQHKRDLLPLGLKTELVMTGTREMWQAAYNLRGPHTSAHPQVKELMEMIDERVRIKP